MPGKRLLGLTSLLGISSIATGCAWMPFSTAPATPTPAETAAAQPLSASSCLFNVEQATAWINKMPGLGRAGARRVIVSGELQNPTGQAILLKSELTSPSVLVLEIRKSEVAPIPGRIAYREEVPEKLWDRIELLCDGETVFEIEDIQSVY